MACRGFVEDSYNFWLYLPETYEKAEELPVVMFLHGKSLSGDSLEMVLRYGCIDAIIRGRKINAMVVAPQAQEAWNPQRVMAIYDWLDDHYKVDTNRFYVLGMSMGGYGTLDVAAAYPDRVAAAIALCGGASGKELCSLSTLPLWIVHGTADELVPVWCSDRVVDSIRSCGDTTRLIYNRLEGENHSRLARVFYLEQTYKWLFSHSLLDKDRPVNRSYSMSTELLNVAYDDFYKKFGLIHSQTNKRYFAEDVSYNLVAGLEKSYDKTKLLEKSDIFTKRTIVPPKAVERVDTALEALTLSIAEKARVDFEYMGKLTGMTEDELKHDLTGEIFKIPHTENDYQTASEYLSGDIRKKLREAEEIAEYDPDFNINVSALKQAMPEPLKAGDIDIKLGAAWLDPKYYEQFMYELLQTPEYQRSTSPSARWNKSAIIGVEYSALANCFHVSNKSGDRSVLATQKYGSHKMNAYDIFEMYGGIYYIIGIALCIEMRCFIVYIHNSVSCHNKIFIKYKSDWIAYFYIFGRHFFDIYQIALIVLRSHTSCKYVKNPVSNYSRTHQKHCTKHHYHDRYG